MANSSADPYAAYGGQVLTGNHAKPGNTGAGADPYAEFGGSVVQAASTGTSAGNWSDPPPDKPGMTPLSQKVGPFLRNLGVGVSAVPAENLANVDQMVSRIPYVGKWLTTPLIGDKTSAQAIADEQRAGQTQGAAQGAGKAIGNAAEFLIPGSGEEAATANFGRLAPLGRIAYNGLTSGLINKAQGGGFGTGAAAGGAAGAFGEGLRALAPSIAESAIGIRKLDRAYGRGPGRAILNETKGFSPGAVAESAQERLDELNPQLESIVDQASSRPRRIAGLLQAPERDIPLNRGVSRGSTRGGLFPAEIRQDFQEGPDLYPEAGNIPGAAEERGTPINGNERYTNGIPNPQYLPGEPHPELSGRFAPPSGVLRTRSATGGLRPLVDEFGRIPVPEALPPAEIPTTEPNRIASLAGPRSIVGGALGTATQRNAAKEVGQLTPLDQFLRTRFNTGETIPAQVTPRELLDLRRGFGSEFVHNWNPETMPGVTGTARNAYHSLSNEPHNIVPEAVPLDRRISNLIPVAKRAESTSLNAPVSQRIAQRALAHTGALAGTIGGSYAGYREHGLRGAMVGGLAGLVGPELIASPTVQMFGARTLASPALQRGLLPLIEGGALQFNRPQTNTDESQNQARAPEKKAVRRALQNRGRKTGSK